MKRKKIENKIVVKSNTIIDSTFNLGLVEQKLLSICLCEIRETHKNIFTISLNDIYELLGVSKNRHAEIRLILENLVKQELIIKDKSPTKDAGTLITHWFSSVKIQEDGTVKIAFDTQLLPYLLCLKNNFTLYSLDNIMGFKNKYTQRFYDFMKRFQKIGKKTMTIEQLRQQLCCENLYPRFSSFESRVINPAIDEINQLTELAVEYERVKEGRSVSKIEFKIRCKKLSEEYTTMYPELKKHQLEYLFANFPHSLIIDAYEKIRKNKRNSEIKNWYAYLLKIITEEIQIENAEFMEEFQFLPADDEETNLKDDGGKLPPLEEKEILPEEEKKKPDFEEMKKNLLNQFKM